jgi:peptidyl-prolyl cis-trans isomerase A (cyclophilin A)
MHCHLCHLALAVVLSLTAFGCSKQPEQPPAATPAAVSAEPVPVDPAKLKPEAAKETAPAKFKVKFTTTKGDFVVEVTRAWAPIGADRFYNLVKLGFFADTRFFRVVPDFVVQFGIHGNPEVAAAWEAATIPDDKQGTQSNQKGTLTFAMAGPDTRTTQVFINCQDNARLDKMGFPPFGKVIQGMDVVNAINPEYGEEPDQGSIQFEGNAYLKSSFPRLDYVKSATIAQ